MKFFADHHFAIGEQHLRQGKPCQDYAYSGMFEEMCFCMVSDGCSSGDNTDIGARLVALAAASAIKTRWTRTGRIFFNEHTDLQINMQQDILLRSAYRALGLTQKDMLATSLYACFAPDGGLIHILGDGVLAWKSSNGQITMHRIDWCQNAPYYPIYGENYKNFIQFHGGDILAEAGTLNEWTYHPSEGYRHIKSSSLSVAEGIQGHSEHFSVWRIREERVEFATIFSDGITQIENMDWKDAVVELLAFKNTTGAFAKRRAINFLKNCRTAERRPMDDVSFGVIHIDHEQ